MHKDFTLQLGLNKQQLAAVTAPLGPVLILAGAGSGKTRALTMRIVYLIKKLGFRPADILAVTFTNKAAGEMKERIVKLLGEPGKIPNSKFQIPNLPTMGTFHSIGAKILRAHAGLINLSPNFVIYDDSDQESMLKEILTSLKIDPTKYKPAMFAAFIDRAKNNLWEPEELEVSDNKTFNQTVRRVYQEYQEQLIKHNACDFGDLIMRPVKLFETHPNVLKAYSELWQYLLVDEYQDTNHAQYAFTKLLAQRHKNIFVVGDDAQAIYGFRGANLQNILDFEDDYPKARIYKLEQNYRSTSPILKVASQIIQLAPQKHSKQIWTENKGSNKPVLYRAEDEMAEAAFVGQKILEIQDGADESARYINDDNDDDDSILSRIMRLSRPRILPKLKNRRGLNNIAVLYRTHAQSRAFEEVFIESSIPYQIVGGLKFYERKEIKDVISFLRLLINPNDLISLKRVINLPPKGIGKATFDLLKHELLEIPNHKHQITNKFQILNSKFQSKPQLQIFFQTLDSLNKLDASATLLDLMRQTLKLTGYETFVKDGTEEGEVRWENIQELFNVAEIFRHLPWQPALNQFLEEVALMTSVDEWDPNSPKVTLMTLHQAKGLEFETVFMVGLEEGLLPHSRSITEPKELAEEIRLAYVGATRAKKRLFLVYAASRRQFGMRNISLPSRIIRAIPEELLDIYEPEF